jgi:hypothetical protein
MAYWERLNTVIQREPVECNHRRNTGPVKRRHCAAAPE